MSILFWCTIAGDICKCVTLVCCIITCPLKLLRVHILLPGYPLTNTRRVPVYPFIGCRMFSALNQDQDCQNRPTRSQYMSIFLHKSFWNWPVTSFRAPLWLVSRIFTPFGALELLNWGAKLRELAWYWVVQSFKSWYWVVQGCKWVPG